MKYYYKGQDLSTIAELVPSGQVPHITTFHSKFLQNGGYIDGNVFSIPVLFTGTEHKITLSGYKINGATVEFQRKGYLPVHFTAKYSSYTPGLRYLINDGKNIFVADSSSATSGTLIGAYSHYKSLAFLLQGAGGGGASRNLFHAGGGGGGGGALLCISKIPVGSWAFLVGGGGRGGSGDNSCGSEGYPTSIVIDGTPYRAEGGKGGGTGRESALGIGGAGGQATDNGTRMFGASGGNKETNGGSFSGETLQVSLLFRYSYNVPYRAGGEGSGKGRGGGGGASAFGTGGKGGGDTSIHGSDGNPGAGGGGGQKAKSSSGGNGGNGCIYIFY